MCYEIISRVAVLAGEVAIVQAKFHRRFVLPSARLSVGNDGEFWKNG